MEKKKKCYSCHDCGDYLPTRDLWICDDDKLRCGGCLDREMERVQSNMMSAVHEHIEGRVEEGR